ncbi:unnamed protein product [Discosporangium mesarthrocarpum]
MLGKECGHPLLRAAAPSEPDVACPYAVEVEEEKDNKPDILGELTDEQVAMGEREAKEMLHDRRRAQLDVYLVCGAYRVFKSMGVGDGAGLDSVGAAGVTEA